MALLRSGRRSSIVSFQSYETARSAGQEDAPTTNGLTILGRKRARKALSVNSDAKEGRTCFPAASALIKNSDEDLKKILIEGSPECVASNVTLLVLYHRLVRPALQVPIGGSVGPGLANPGVRRLAPKSWCLQAP